MSVGEVGVGEGVGEELAAVGAALERFVSRPLGERTGDVVRAEMVGCRRYIDRLELAFAGRMTELARLDELEWQGHTSPIDWAKEECHLTGTAAWDALVVGQQAARLPESTRALVAGEIGYAHLALMARTAEWVDGLPVVAIDLLEAGMPDPAGPDAADPGAAPAGPPLPPLFTERTLLRKARGHSVAELRRDCAHYRHEADPRRFLAEQVEQVEERFLELKTTEGGALALRGYLDSEAGATLRSALEPLARPSGEGDDRNRDRRFADALVELAGHALDSGVLPQHSGQRPHLQVTASLATVQGQDGAPAAELDLGGPVAAETARRLGCDASVTRVVFGAESAVLDVGRATRVPATATRRAVQVRDRGCVWPGCHRPASWGEVHHLRHWAQGGSTDLDNLVTICRVHHWRVHEGGWRLIRTDEGMLALPPAAGDRAAARGWARPEIPAPLTPASTAGPPPAPAPDTG
jgi:hypothetical protein